MIYKCFYPNELFSSNLYLNHHLMKWSHVLLLQQTEVIPFKFNILLKCTYSFFGFCFCFFFFFCAALHSMRDPSSPTRDRTCVPLHWKHRVLTTGPPGKSLHVPILDHKKHVQIFLREKYKFFYLQPLRKA